MRVKRVRIGIKGAKEVLGDFSRTAKAIEKGEKHKGSRGIYFENLASFRKALTEKRMEMLHVIREKRPSSVYALARMLDRDLKSVNYDLNLLKEVGLVEVKKTKEKKERSVPEVRYDRIDLEIAI